MDKFACHCTLSFPKFCVIFILKPSPHTFTAPPPCPNWRRTNTVCGLSGGDATSRSSVIKLTLFALKGVALFGRTDDCIPHKTTGLTVSRIGFNCLDRKMGRSQPGGMAMMTPASRFMICVLEVEGLFARTSILILIMLKRKLAWKKLTLTDF